MGGGRMPADKARNLNAELQQPHHHDYKELAIIYDTSPDAVYRRHKRIKDKRAYGLPKARIGPRPVLTEEHDQAVWDLLEQLPFAYQDEIQDFLYEVFEVKISQSTISRQLDRIHLNRKKFSVTALVDPFALLSSADGCSWETLLFGANFKTAMDHLRSIGIVDLSASVGADDLARRILDSALEHFRWNVTSSAMVTETSRRIGPDHEPRSRTSSIAPAPHAMRNSIDALLNAPDCTTPPPQTQLSSIRISSVINATVAESRSSAVLLPEIRSSAHGPPDQGQRSGRSCRQQTTRRAGSLAPPDSTFVQPSNGNCTVELSKVKAIDCGPNVARMANVDRLQLFLGQFLYNGMIASCTRIQEKNSHLTDALRLHIADEGEDYKIEVWVCSPVGKSLAQKTSSHPSDQDWSFLLGQHLFEAIQSRRQCQGYFRRGIVNAVTVFATGEDESDCIVGLMVGARVGFNLLKELYPDI